MKYAAVTFWLLLAGCQTMQSPPRIVVTDEDRARAMCEDMIALDVRAQAGEGFNNHCVQLRLREIRAGLK